MAFSIYQEKYRRGNWFSKMILRGATIEALQIFIMREENVSHPLDLLGSRALIMLRIVLLRDFDRYETGMCH